MDKVQNRSKQEQKVTSGSDSKRSVVADFVNSVDLDLVVVVGKWNQVVEAVYDPAEEVGIDALGKVGMIDFHRIPVDTGLDLEEVVLVLDLDLDLLEDRPRPRDDDWMDFVRRRMRNAVEAVERAMSALGILSAVRSSPSTWGRDVELRGFKMRKDDRSSDKKQGSSTDPSR